MKRHLLLVIFVYICFFTAPLFSSDSLPGIKMGNFSISGYGAFVNYKIEEFIAKSTKYKDLSETNMVLNLTMNLALGEYITGHIGLEGYLYHNTLPLYGLFQGGSNKQKMYWTMYPHQIEGRFSFGNSEVFSGEIGAGLFPYKYSPEARNLGEYLFRSGTYPGYLFTNFDQCWQRLTGIRFSSTLFNIWKNDLLFTKEMELPPYGDGTITWISDISILDDLFDFGAGISLSHFIPANKKNTTPKEKHNERIIIIEVDSLGNIVQSDTLGYYTFKGIKAMCRLTLDPKVILQFIGADRLLEIFGKEDFKIFGELAILGLEDQTPIYSDINERMPIMFGLNIPFPSIGKFRLWDVCSFQMEYYNCPYPNDYEYIYSTGGKRGIAVPASTPGLGKPGNGSEKDYQNDNWKWSVYANKFFGDHLGLICQFARDHWRTNTTYIGMYDYETSLIKYNHWYWAIKAVFIF